MLTRTFISPVHLRTTSIINTNASIRLQLSKKIAEKFFKREDTLARLISAGRKRNKPVAVGRKLHELGKIRTRPGFRLFLGI